MNQTNKPLISRACECRETDRPIGAECERLIETGGRCGAGGFGNEAVAASLPVNANSMKYFWPAHNLIWNFRLLNKYFSAIYIQQKAHCRFVSLSF